MDPTTWQMLPAYAALAAALALAAMWRWAPCRRWLRGHRRVRMALLASGIAMLASTIAAWWAFPIFELPRPGGKFAVGTTEFHFIDRSRAEMHTANPLDRRELMVRAWYPARRDPGLARAPYLRQAAAIRRLVNREHWPFGWLFSHLDRVPTHAYADAPLPEGNEAYPVLVFSHGLAMGHAGQNTVLAEELASQGYVVFAIDHTYDGLAAVFPDGRVAGFLAEAYDVPEEGAPAQSPASGASGARRQPDPRSLAALARRTVRERPLESRLRRYWYASWSRDQRFVLDRIEALQAGKEPGPFAGRLRTDRMGVFGMSFGGVAAALTCATDPRCAAGANLDGFGDVAVEFPPQTSPFLYFGNEDTDDNAMFLELDRGYRYFVQVAGARHMDFSDLPLISPLARLSGATGTIGADRMFGLTHGYVGSFFDRHLRGRPAALLDGPSKDFPEARFMMRAPGS